MATQIKNHKNQTFLFDAPEAHEVLLAGDFTNWQQDAIPMHRRNGGQWTATVALQLGEHYYRYIVDGEWRDDPQCNLRAPNPFGSQDMVAQVG
jgi:1,4-alpha-glucan branching enzyme